MPQYQYKCDNCGNVFDEILKMSERLAPTSEPCVQCQHMSVRQMLTPINYGGERVKPTGGFKEVIQKIKEREPHNNLPDY